MARFRDRAAALRETAAPGSPDGAEGTLQLVEGSSSGVVHLLAGESVGDGEMLELLLETGWVAGHYRAQLHPESAGPPSRRTSLARAVQRSSTSHPPSPRGDPAPFA